MKSLRVLIISDDQPFLSQAEKTLTREKYGVTGVSDFEKAEAFLDRVHGKTVVVSELTVGRKSALAFLKETLRKYPFLPFTLASSSPSLESAMEAIRLGAFDFLRKPVSSDVLRNSVARSVEKLNLVLENEKQEKEIRDLLSRSGELMKKLEARSAFKGFLISMAAHDFKSLLTVMDGYHQVMREKCPACPSPLPASLMDKIGGSIRRLRSMAATLLDYEAAERGLLRPTTIPFDLDDLLTDSVAFYRPYAGLKNVTLGLDGDLPPIKAKGDPVMVMQVLDNLIYNAVKFTPANGDIRIGVRVDDQNSATVWVSDTGIGIPKGLQKELFKESYIATSRDVTSRVGLGLNICRKLLEIQEGKLWVESATGKGTKIYFSLPMQ